ncbi:MAG TPA: acetate--CoA ligase family protein [bacterium]|nr:acetate--CoA ligase family protein [bacterium]
MSILDKAIAEKTVFLSEFEAKQLLKEYHIPVTDDRLVGNVEQAVSAADALGYPVVLKGCGRTLLHKTEMNLVQVNLTDADAVRRAATDMFARLPQDADGLLVSPMLDTRREFIAGVTQDVQFGPVVAFGLGGIFTETIKDVAFRVAPFEVGDGVDLIRDVQARKLMYSVRGLPAIDREAMANLLSNLSKLAAEQAVIEEVDCNPILTKGDQPVVVDALIKLRTKA